MVPLEIDRLRDELCIRLLVATSSLAALADARRQIREQVPVYAEDDAACYRAARIQPRDLIRPCERCGDWYVARLERHRWCSFRCRLRASQERRRRRRAESGSAAHAADGVAS